MVFQAARPQVWMGSMRWIFLSAVVVVVHGLTATKAPPLRVVVTGAAGSVGFHVVQKLVRSKTFEPIALIRQGDRKGSKALEKLGLAPSQIVRADITDKSSLKGVFRGAKKVIMCTSATPRMKLWARLLTFVLRLFGIKRPASINDLYYPRGQEPFLVDFIGQKNVIDECVAEQVGHIVMLGNMGGYRGSKLNDVGRVEGNEKRGNLLKWKRAAERYLMRRCFFTIVHAAALTDEKGGRREIVFDTDDALLRTSFRRIPKEDVAEVLIQALLWKEAIGRYAAVAVHPAHAHAHRTTPPNPHSSCTRIHAHPQEHRRGCAARGSRSRPHQGLVAVLESSGGQCLSCRF